jgi:hypothetical protein
LKKIVETAKKLLQETSALTVVKEDTKESSYVVEEIQDIFVDVNKGFFYSVFKTLRNPGKTAREYVEGNRVDHYKPIALTFVLAGISIFVSLVY